MTEAQKDSTLITAPNSSETARVMGTGAIRCKIRNVGALCFWVMAAALVSVERVHAAGVQSLFVRQGGEGSWSKWYNVDGRIVLGYELNRAVGGSDYDDLSYYTVVFWAPNQASVIKMSGGAVCTSGPSASCVVLQKDGADQEGRSWQVCSSTAELLCSR
jgi:hypothetical protein